jgi:hypothetical protein
MARHPTPVQLQLLDYILQPGRRKVLGAFRGVGKSTLAAMTNLWLLDQNPNEKVLVVSASAGRAAAMTSWMQKTVIEVPWLAHLAPDTKDGRYSRVFWDVGNCPVIEQSPSVRAAGITGQITGWRATRILSDDIETPTTALTQLQREKLRNAINEYEAILKPDVDGSILFLGTPHSSTESIYFFVRRTLKYDMRLWPARVPEKVLPYNGCLAPVIQERMPEHTGRPTDTRFTDNDLRERQLSMSPLQWRLQYMLDPTLSDLERYPLRCRDLMVVTVDDFLPEIIRYEPLRSLVVEGLGCPGMAHDSSWYRPAESIGAVPVSEAPCVLALDPSGGGADEFGWAIVRAWAGNFYLVDCGGHRNGVTDDFFRSLARKVVKYGVNEILVETNFGGLDVWAQAFKPFLKEIGTGCHFEPIRSNMQKERRIIDTLAPLLQTHKVAVDQRVIEADNLLIEGAQDDVDLSYSLFYQLTRLTYDRGALRHDDRLDAFATACAWFQEQVAQRQEERQDARRIEMLENSVADRKDGLVLMTADRLAMGMTVDQARRAQGGATRGNWIRRRG